MKIKRILLDLDDVCNQLTLACLDFVGCNVKEQSDIPPCFGYDIISQCNYLHPTKKDWTTEEFWNSIPREIWAKAPKSKEFKQFFPMCVDAVGQENVFIATSPTKDPDSLAGKLEWIHDNLPAYMHRQYLITPRKWLCANEETLLIDDNDFNVKMFHQGKGKAIIFPRPWNSLSGVDVMKHVKKKFEENGLIA